MKDNVLKIERMLKASRSRVWQAIQDSKQFRRWWGQPKGASVPIFEMDFKVGGELFFKVELPGSNVVWAKCFYKEIVEEEKIVLEDHYADDHGNPIDSKDWPPSKITLHLKDAGSGTKLTVIHEGLGGGMSTIDEYKEGWSQSLDLLEEVLSS